MPGLNLQVGGFGGVGSTSQPAYGTSTGYSSVTEAAFGPGMTVEAPGMGTALNPRTPVGMSTIIGVTAVVLLVCIRRSLPR